VLSAFYYHTIKYGFEQGLQRYDVGECRPFTTDGIYLHKQRWGMYPVRDLWGTREWMLWAPDQSPVAMQWLNAHPLVLPEARPVRDRVSAGWRPANIVRRQ
jgi:hypothetical protein